MTALCIVLSPQCRINVHIPILMILLILFILCSGSELQLKNVVQKYSFFSEKFPRIFDFDSAKRFVLNKSSFLNIFSTNT